LGRNRLDLVNFFCDDDYRTNAGQRSKGSGKKRKGKTDQNACRQKRPRIPGTLNGLKKMECITCSEITEIFPYIGN
jgi:hypothetical protein